jgi:hypothetical protein
MQFLTQSAYSVLRRALDGINHQHFNRPLGRFQLQAELLFKSNKK